MTLVAVGGVEGTGAFVDVVDAEVGSDREATAGGLDAAMAGCLLAGFAVGAVGLLSMASVWISSTAGMLVLASSKAGFGCSVASWGAYH